MKNLSRGKAFRAFVQKDCEVSAETETPYSDVRRRYVSRCALRGDGALARDAFVGRLWGEGFQVVGRGVKRVVRGMRLTEFRE